jgi:hypothetical protein
VLRRCAHHTGPGQHQLHLPLQRRCVRQSEVRGSTTKLFLFPRTWAAQALLVRVVRTHDNRNSGILINALKKRFNITASASGRNDILVDGKKISGSAYKISNGVRLVPPPSPKSPPRACVVSLVPCVVSRRMCRRVSRLLMPLCPPLESAAPRDDADQRRLHVVGQDSQSRQGQAQGMT